MNGLVCHACSQGVCKPVTDGSDPGTDSAGACGVCKACYGGICGNMPAGSATESSCFGYAGCDGNGQCACTNGVKDGLEVDVDCGIAADCGQCVTGSSCTYPVDCETKCCDTFTKICLACTDMCTCQAPYPVCQMSGVCT